MSKVLGDAPTAYEQRRFTFCSRAFFRWVTVAGAAAAIGFLATVRHTCNWPSSMGNSATKTTASTAARLTMNRFIGTYCILVRLRGLPFPVRNAPVKDRLGKVNGSGAALHSWRAEVSDFAWCWDVGWDGSQPWDSAADRGLMWRDWCFSADGTPKATADSVQRQTSFPQTVMVAIVGPGTAFGDGRTRTPVRGMPPGAVLLVESRASGIPWPAPGDFDIRTMPHTINAQDGSGVSGQNPGGFVVLFADGQAWFLSEKVPFDTLERFFTIDGAKRHDRERSLGPFALDRLRNETAAELYEKGEIKPARQSGR